MTSLRTARRLAVITAIFGASVGWNAEPPRSAAANAKPGAPARDSQNRVGKILPDPVLLDGSAHPVEKKPDYGMIGDFELPGDENAQANRVGGPINPNQKGGPPNAAKPGGLQVQGLPMPMGIGGGGGEKQPGGAGAQGIPPIAAAGAQGGVSGPSPTDGSPTGGGQGGGVGQPNAGGQPIAGGGQPGAQAQGIQVAELGGEGSGGLAGAGGMSRPPPVMIGDKAMRIDPAAASPTTVGVQPQLPDGHIQQHKATGTGGKPPTSPQGPGRIEKGSTIPAGL